MERTLFRDDPIVTTYEDIKVADIDELIPDAANIVTQPTASFIENVAQNGIIQPILLIKRGKGKKYDLAAGRRRIIAAKKCGLETIPARIWPVGYSKLDVLTLSENEQRKSNALAEYLAVEKMLAAGDTEDDIVVKTGILKKKLLTLLSLRNLVPDLMKAFQQGAIKSSVALKASKQKKPVQRKLVTVFNTEGSLHATDIADVRRVLKDETVNNLPADLFGNHPDDWKDRANYALAMLKTQIEGEAPAEFLTDLDILIAQTQGS
jgi:ParB/RepB/Spo0J family partition protein